MKLTYARNCDIYYDAREAAIVLAKRGKHFLHDTFIDIAEDTVGLSALDNEFSEVSAFHHGDSLFVRCHANQNATLRILNSH